MIKSFSESKTELFVQNSCMMNKTENIRMTPYWNLYECVWTNVNVSLIGIVFLE